jgi:hypothetical protein
MTLRAFFVIPFILQTGSTPHPTSAGAEAFVRGLYQRETNESKANDGAFAGHAGADAIYSPSLLALIRRDIARTPKGDVGKLDYDPICGCQDSDGISVQAIQVVAASESHTNALVALRFSGGSQQRLTLKLVYTTRGWRVDDVEGPKGYLPLRSLLTAAT